MALLVLALTLIALTNVVRLVFSGDEPTSRETGAPMQVEQGLSQARAAHADPSSAIVVDEEELAVTSIPEAAVESVDDSAYGFAAATPEMGNEPLLPAPQPPEAPQELPSERQAVFTPGLVDILSPVVSRFVLTDGVKQLEPQGGVETVVLPGDAPPRLFAFSEVNNMKDEHLRYIWKYQNRVVSVVNIGVWSNHWRSYSSKFIETRLAGDWLVELRGGDDRLLGQARFRFQP